MPYLLLLPGALWLLVFFIVPLVQLFTVSLQSQFPGYPGYYYRDVNFGNYAYALTDFAPQFFRSFAFAGLATFFAFCLAYPLAYAIAFKAGRWRNVMLIAVDRAVLHLVHPAHVAWRQILSDEGPVASTLNFLHLLPGGRHHRDLGRGRGRPHLQLPAVHGAADLRLPRAGRPAGHRGRRRPVRRRVHHVPQGDPAAVSMPGVLAGTLLTFIPAAGDYVNAELLGSENTKMIGNVIESQFFRVLGGYPTAAALSFTLMALILALVFVYIRRFGTEELI